MRKEGIVGGGGGGGGGGSERRKKVRGILKERKMEGQDHQISASFSSHRGVIFTVLWWWWVLERDYCRMVLGEDSPILPHPFPPFPHLA